MRANGGGRVSLVISSKWNAFASEFNSFPVQFSEPFLPSRVLFTLHHTPRSSTVIVLTLSEVDYAKVDIRHPAALVQQPLETAEGHAALRTFPSTSL